VVLADSSCTARIEKMRELNMRLSSLDIDHAEPVVYDDEPAEERVARRMELVTPVIECPF